MLKLPGYSALLVLILVLFAAPPPANAGGKAGGEEGAGLVGKWRFITAGDYEGYVNGNMRVGLDASGALTCKLVVYQSEFGSAVERCVISQSADEIVITAVEVVTSSVPKWRREVFHLSPGEDEMTGTVKIVVDFPVRFTRKK